MDVNDSMALLQTVFEAFWSFGGIFIYCEFGERLGQLFVEVDDAVYQLGRTPHGVRWMHEKLLTKLCPKLDWYLFPSAIRRMLPTLIANVQQPVEIECFGSINCCRDAFKQVSLFIVIPYLG